MMAMNALAGTNSPYLLQHATNPVEWVPWSEAALARAQSEGKMILLSIGYAACHWCHVMAHESFENRDIAALMNAHFVNIKVDREERPDLDHIYMSALQEMGEQGGWPLTMFLTPQGVPIYGGTYFPPEPRWNRPGFPQVLRTLVDAWEKNRERLEGRGLALWRRLAARAAAPSGPQLTPVDLDWVVERFISRVDWEQGGLQGAPKFPNAPIFRFLWSEFMRSGRREAAEAVTLTMARMSQGGIFDHLGGGFARYSTDAQWLVPHFEKMLYDNALLLELLALTHAAEPSTLFAARAAETVEWLRRDMRAEADPAADGSLAFCASEDADSEGEEGKFYVWTRSEIGAALGPDLAFFEEHYWVPPAGNWEGKIIFTRRTYPGDQAQEDKLQAMRAQLLAVRSKRVRPTRDDKLLADWNGLMIAALARASAVFDQPGWLDLAREAYSAVNGLMRVADGRYEHAYRRGVVTASGLLDDQAAMLRAALALYQVTGDIAYLAHAERTAALVQRVFADPEGGFFITAEDINDLPGGIRPRGAVDGPTPSGAGMMAEGYATLLHLTGNAAYRQRAERLISVVTGERQALPAYPTVLVAAALLEGATSVVITGDPSLPAYRGLHRAALRSPSPLVVVLPVAGGDSLAAGHPAHGKLADRPAAFVCRGQECSLPVFEPDRVLPLIGRPAV